MSRILNTYLDASENAFLRRELEHVRAETYEIDYPDNEGRLLVPIDHSVPTGAEIVTFNTLQGVGQSRVGGGYSNEAPRVDVKISDESQRIIPIVASYGYSFQEVRNSMMSGRSLPMLRAQTARDVIEQDMSQLLLLGNTAEGMSGLFTLSNTCTYTVANGALGSALWANKTSLEKVADLHAMGNQIITDTLKIERPDTLVLPLTAFNHVNQTPMGDGNNKTILAYFLENDVNIKSVESSVELESNSAWTGRRMMAYKKDKSKLQGVIPQEFEQFAPQQRGFETIVNCHARYGGIELYKPKSVCYGDNF